MGDERCEGAERLQAIYAVVQPRAKVMRNKKLYLQTTVIIYIL
jgi:hypothetical protein